MKIKLTRDSVCAADDCDAPHAKTVPISSNMTICEMLRLVQREFIPGNIQGGKATWSVVTSIPIAVIAQQWAEPRLLPMIDGRVEKLANTDGNIRIHVNYHAQIDPEIVLAVLQELKLPESNQQSQAIAAARGSA